jgi:hypothetical protein
MYISPADHSQVSMVTIKIKMGDDLEPVPQKEFPFIHLLDLRYRPGESVTDFYNQYRSQVIANMTKQGEVIAWENSYVLSSDEELSPTFEDLILANVLRRINKRLPGLVRSKYQPLIGQSKSLMDYKSEIFAEVPFFLAQIENNQPAAANNDNKLLAR